MRAYSCRGDCKLAKINVLLQTYISELKLEGVSIHRLDVFYVPCFAVSGVPCVVQNGGMTNVGVLAFCAQCCPYLPDRTRWGSITPLRQFKGILQEVIRKAEGKQFVRVKDVAEWHVSFVILATVPLFRSESARAWRLIGIPNAGRLVHQLVRDFSKLQ